MANDDAGQSTGVVPVRDWPVRHLVGGSCGVAPAGTCPLLTWMAGAVLELMTEDIRVNEEIS